MTATLYEADFVAWADRQAALLRAGRRDELDIVGLLDEVESLSKSERRGLKNQLRRLLMHLLKWRFQPELLVDGTNPSWIDTIDNARDEIETIVEDSPSLAREIPGFIVLAYPKARKDAIKETRLPLTAFPEACPFTVEQVLDKDWLP